MNSKTIIGGVIAGILSFFLGWLVFGVLMQGYYEANSQAYTWLVKANPVIWALAVANLCWGLLLAYVLHMCGVNNSGRGFVIGFIVFFLVSAGVNMFTVGLMNLIKIRLAAVDTILDSLIGGILGAVIGLWYGRSAKAIA